MKLSKETCIYYSLEEFSNKSDQKDSIDIFKALVPYSVNVTKICMPHVCDDELLMLIAVTCFKLSELDVSYSKHVTGEGLLALFKNKCPLKILNISCTSVSTNDVEILLKNMPTLQKVHHELFLEVLYSIHKEDVDYNTLDNITKYNFIEFNFMLLKSSKLVYLLTICSKLCPSMKKIAVSVESNEELKLCFLFSELEEVFIESSSNISYFQLNDFLSVRGINLKHLALESCTLSMSTLIACCSNLETLSLHNIEYQQLDKSISIEYQQTDKIISTPVHKLKILNLESVEFKCDLTVESIVMLLSSSRNLENFSIQYSTFSHSKLIEKLSSFPLNCSIKHLNFCDSDVEIEHLEQLVLNCSALERLYIKECESINLEEFDMLTKTISSRKGSIDVFYGVVSSDLWDDEMDFTDDLSYLCEDKMDLFDDSSDTSV